MTATGTILVATDFSPPSRHAVVRAAMLAAERGCALHLLHVLERGGVEQLRSLLGLDSEDVLARLRQDARDALFREAREVGQGPDLSVVTHLAEGALLDAIGAEAGRLGAGLLVVGQRGAGFMQRMLLGSTAERLLRLATGPVLVVRASPRASYRRVLLAVDFSSLSARVVALARELFPTAQLTVMHACQLPFEGKLRFAGVDDEAIVQYRQLERRQAAAALQALTGPEDGRLRTLVAEGEAPWCIQRQAEEMDADLVVLGKHGTSATEELLLGSVTKHVLVEASADVLVVR